MFGLALCAGAGVVSCSSDVDDPMDSIPYNRVLTPMNFEAEVVASKGTDITFKWSAVQNASSYVLELFDAVETVETDENGTETTVFLAPDYDNAVPALSVDVPADKVPYTVADLEVDKTFYARVRGVSTKVPASHWAYLTEAVSTSAVRSMLNPVVVERTMSAVTIAWDDAEDKEDLTSVRVLPVMPAENEKPRTIALTAEQKTACKAEITGLDACRNYKFTLLFGKSGSRGVVTAWTRPDTEGANRIESAEALYNALNGATGNVKILLAYSDEAYDLKSYLTTGAGTANEKVVGLNLNCTLSIYGESTDAGKKPVISNFELDLIGSDCKSVHLEDLALDGGNNFGYVLAVPESATTELPTSIEFANCEISNFTKGLFSVSDKAVAVNGKCENFLVEGAYVHDVNPVGANGGDFIDARKGAFGSLNVKNSTFYASARSFIRFSEVTCSIERVDVANCTFNQVTATNTSSNNSGVFHLRYTPTSKPEAYQPLASFTLTNCVFLNMNNVNETNSKYWVRLTRESNENYAPTCAGNIFYNVGHDDYVDKDKKPIANPFFPTKSLNLNGDAFSKELALAGGGMILAEDPCVNSIAGKMYLKNGIIAANRVGDPRWWDLSEPVVIRPTELTAVTEPTVWDFTEKTKFQTETIETNQIIENIRIYAPAEVVMGEGVTFASAATVDRNGRPTSSALQFRVQGVGAVEVTTADAGFNASVEVVAAGDRYTLLADGKTHKVALGDLAGENDIYILAGSAVTFTKVAWTDDLTPEATMQKLAVPVVTLEPASVTQGDETAVTASWKAVENAVTYEVTFQGKKSEITETSFTIDAAAVAALFNGKYPLTVVAKPVTTSSKYLASDAASVELNVKKKIVAGLKTVSWNFNDASFDEVAAAIGTTDNTTADVTYTVNGVGLNLVSGGSKLKIETRAYNGVDKWRCFRTGGKSSLTGAAISFTAVADGGTLVVTGKNPSGSATETTALTLTVYVNGTASSVTGAIVGKDFKTVELDLEGAVKAGDKVNLITTGGISFAMMEYSYIDPNGALTTTEYLWDFKNDKTTYPSETVETVKAFTPEHGRALTLIGASGSPITIENGKRIKMGGKTTYDDKGIPTVRALSFVAEGSGVLSFVHASASSSGQGRLTTVRVDGVDAGVSAEAPIDGFSSSTAAVTWDSLEVSAGQTVYICVSGGINFESIKWVETK